MDITTKFQQPQYITLYDGVKSKHLNVKKVASYISNYFNRVRIELRDDIIVHHLSQFNKEEQEQRAYELAVKLAQVKIRHLGKENNNGDSLLGEVKFEEKWLLKQSEKPRGLLYDAVKLQRLLFGLLPQKERNPDYLHIVILNQLFGTWDQANRRYHARVSIYGIPCLISITGLVEAPAKPREFYLKRQAGVNLAELKKEFQDRFIDYDSPKMTELMKGYVMQAVFYYMIGEPFCDDKQCRLFNAHWQEELIRAQLNGGHEFCPRHQEILESINRSV